MEEEDRDYSDEYNDETDEWEEAIYNCHGSYFRGVFWCGAAGSEECDWECPFSQNIGKRKRAK